MSRAQFMSLLAECQKYPLSLRAAKEVFNAGIKATYVEEKWSPSGSVFCKHLIDALQNFERGKGIDPDFVPSISPVYYEVKKLPTRKSGRPGTVEAFERVEKIVDELVKEGWERRDFFDAVSDLDGPPVVSSIAVDEDQPVMDVPQKSLADDAEGVKKVARTGCAYCPMPLGTVYIVEEGSLDTFFCHVSCWRKNNAELDPPKEGENLKDAASGKKLLWSSVRKAFLPPEEYALVTKA